ncbi:hypothetical protein DICPUDRAFT_75970 [Dictyostelium purpureum]|uniref:ADP-ribosylation factor n=1 Tax=Dictyostelium purpureum TaxID=5786 RepID=F0ZC74_DICPU|nr:uncharacterized protein DICPUDRAFT_75970 [Dictyostelium purpureum]EGC38472.1 hypothetical protein DICPUDRAFT_75970 [Dictyostelium purpureum]|eukprot:XP_003285030.1 hypothetical protein DICPUDRAFT_75970 [Dictyostelium purpureum]
MSTESKISNLFDKHDVKFLMVGPKGAGKTTILQQLKLGEIVTKTPIIETVQSKNINFIVCDIDDDYYKIRSSLGQYFLKPSPKIQAFIIVADSSDIGTLQENRDEFHKILDENDIGDVPILVLCNKQDLPNAKHTSVVNDTLHINSIYNRKWHTEQTCATSGEGLYEGFKWLSEFLYGPKFD